MHRFYTVVYTLSLMLALTASAEVSITATFNPPRIAMGDKAQYVVEIRETSTDRQPRATRVDSLPIPESGGLQLMNGRVSTSNQTSILNGAAQYSSTQQLIIDAKAPRTGRFTIPTYTFQYKGETYRAPAATLEVIERSADAGPTIDELIFLKADIPETLYIGQTTPIVLKLYVSQDVRLSGLSNFDRNADGFTIGELPESTESAEVFNGRRYRVLNWPLSITPIQTGRQDIGFQFDITAQIPDRNGRGNSPGRRTFGNSIFDDFFGRSERFALYTEPMTVDVRPVPTADKPASFNGAIGDFALQVYTDLQETEVGEPIMLSVEISGQGNFSRINGPTIPDSKNWRSYEPETQFQPSAPGNTVRGTKRFDYVMIPRTAGQLMIPDLAFSYLNPETGRYVTMTAPEIAIDVNPSANQPISQTPQIQQADGPALTATSAPVQNELSVEETLLTLDYRPQASSKRNQPFLNSIVFWMVNGVVATALFLTCQSLRHRRRLKEDTAYAAQHAAKKEREQATATARSANEPEAFYQSAQNAIRLAVTHNARRNFRSANIDELTQFLKASGTSDETIERMRTLFQEADQLRFSGKADTRDLANAKAKLDQILKTL